MKGRTHLSFGLFVFLLTVYFGYGFSLIGLILILIFSIVPDIDKFGSKISKKLFPFSLIFNLFKHRGVIHSLLIPSVLLIVGIFYHIVNYCALGWVSHLVLDGLTPSGVMPFYPLFKQKLRFIFKGDLIFFWGINLGNVILGMVLVL